MVAVRVAAQHNLDVIEIEAELRGLLLQQRNCPLEATVDEDVPLVRCDQKRRKRLRPDVVDVVDDVVCGERLVRNRAIANRASKQFLNRGQVVRLGLQPHSASSRQQESASTQTAGHHAPNIPAPS